MKWFNIILFITVNLLFSANQKAFSQKSNSDTVIILKPDQRISDTLTPDLLKYNKSENFSQGKTVILKNNYRKNIELHFIVIFLLIVGVIYIKLSSPGFFNELTQLLLKRNYLIANYNQQKINLLLNNIILDLIYVVSISYFLYFFTFDFETINFFIFILAILIFYLLQIGLVGVLFSLFFNNSMNIHMANLFIFNRSLAVLIAPLIFIIFFIETNHQKVFIYLIATLFISFLVFRTFRIYFQIKKENRFNYLYVFLYLCVSEISVYLIVFKEIKKFF